MIDYLMELLLFFMPGVLTEILFCALKKQDPVWWVRLGRMLLFSMTCLALRCVASVLSGHGGLEIGAVFHGIGNYLKYCAVSAMEVIVMPPCLLILEKLFHFIQADDEGEQQ